MRLFDGRDTLEVERTGDTVRVLLGGAQIRMASLEVVRQHAVVAEETPEEYEAVLEYTLPPGAQTLRQLTPDAKTRLAKLQTAQRLSLLRARAGKFTVPFLHPENIVLTGAGASVTHSGLTGVLAPMGFDEELFLRGYRALVLSVFFPRLSFDKLIDGSAVLNDPFSKRLSSCASVEEIVTLIEAELAVETAREARHVTSVSKRRYRTITVLGAVAVVAALALGWFTYTSYSIAQPRMDAIVTAQSNFLTNDYAQTLTDLRDYNPADLPKSARYVLAVSSVELSELTGAQKQAVLAHISTKTDDNTLDYWIFLARGELDRALNLAQNLGDDQLTLLTYTELYQATKLNATMDGARKLKLLDDYAKKIQELTARLSAAR